MPGHWGRLLALCLPFFTSGPAWAAAPPEPLPSSSSIRTAEVRFGSDLGLSDIRLTRPHESRRVAFASEAGWKPVEGSRLHLFLSHSARIDAGRSFLTVSLNDAIVRSIRLDELNEDLTEIEIPLAPALLRRRNELRFGVVQFAGEAGVTDVWTSIGARSYLSIAHQEQPWRRDLREFPLPLLDPAMPRPKRLAVLLPAAVTATTLEATAVLVANLALHAAPQALMLSFARSADDGSEPLLVAGTSAEQPIVRQLRTSAVAPATGIVGLASTGRARRPTLYVTGATPEAVLRGAWGLVVSSSTMEGELALVAGEPPRVAREARAWKGFIPPKTRFRLAEAGHGPQTLEGETPLRLPVRATPDARFLAYGHSLTLSLRPLPALFDHPQAQVEIAWNDVALARLAPRELPLKAPFALRLKLPGERLRPENVLTVAWRPPAASGTAGPLASLDPEASTLYLPRDYEARLPDLAVLRSWLYPFSMHVDLSDVVLVMPDTMTSEVFVLVCEAAAFLGQALPTDLVGFRLRQPSTLTAEERASAHLILLRAAPASDAFDPVLPDWRQAPGRPASTLAVLQEAESPWSAGRYVLSLRAGSASALLRGFRMLVEPKVWERLEGDTAFLSPKAPVCVVLGKPRLVRQADPLTHVLVWLRSHWLAIPLLVTLVSALLFVALRLALAHRRVGAGGGYLTAPKGASRPS